MGENLKNIIKAAIPWWTRIIIKMVLSRLPFNYSFWQKFGLFRHGQMDQVDYAVSVFENHIKVSTLYPALSGKVILELGPGDSLATSLLCAKHGAIAILVDAGFFAIEGIEQYRELNLKYVTNNTLEINLNKCNSIHDLLLVTGAQYMTEGLRSLKKIPSNSVDFIFSQAVLEHVRKEEFFETMSECFRILKKNGICSHQVDLKDHLGGGLNNLRFDSQVWESDFFVNSGFYTNRIRFSEMIDIFKKSQFEVLDVKNKKFANLPLKRTSLALEFQKTELADLMISEFDVLLKK